MVSEYCELDGTRVVAILENDCVPALQWSGSVDVGRIVGVATHEHLVMPTWLAEVMGDEGEALRIVVRCMLAQAAAGVWYGTATWLDHAAVERREDVGFRPANYDVYGVLPKSCEGPPVVVERRYVRIPRLRMFVPPPYRRGFCWYAEAEIAHQGNR